jgi:hypothetical protein
MSILIIAGAVVVIVMGVVLTAYALVEGKPLYVVIGLGLIIANVFIIATNLEILRMRQ